MVSITACISSLACPLNLRRNSLETLNWQALR
jgi:hypothetical protein